LIAIFCGALMLCLVLQTAPSRAAVSSDEMRDLCAPIALYPDSLLSNVLAAATYPGEVTEAWYWVKAHGALQASDIESTLQGYDWDPTVKALTAFPDVLKMMAENIPWTTALGNAFLTQRDDVFGTIQNLRAAARSNGVLTNGSQQRITDDQGAIVIEPTNPEIIYVPYYEPSYVFYGEYPSYGYYPYYYPLVFGAGVLCGNWLWTGVCDWHYHNLYFGRGYNCYYHGGSGVIHPWYHPTWNRVRKHEGMWSFNPQHRHGVPMPSTSVMPGGRGYAMPGATGPRTWSAPHTTMPSRPGGWSAPRAAPSSPHHVTPVRPSPRATPRTTAAPRAWSAPHFPNVPSIYNVRPGGTVQLEQGRGAASRNHVMPTPVRPIQRPQMSAPRPMPSQPTSVRSWSMPSHSSSMPRTFSTPHTVSAPRSAPRSSPRGGGRR
jgi:hypothetical protein